MCAVGCPPISATLGQDPADETYRPGTTAGTSHLDARAWPSPVQLVDHKFMDVGACVALQVGMVVGKVLVGMR